jgi:hypothetical protein
MASVVRILFFVSFLRGILGASKPREPLAAVGTSSINKGLARLSLGLPSSSLMSLSVDDRAESGSQFFSFLEKDAEVETDPPVDSGALEDVGDRAEAIEEPNAPFAFAAIIGSLDGTRGNANLSEGVLW